MGASTNPYDWRDELIKHGVLRATKQFDGNGNLVYEMTGQFPPGPEGERLRELFDANVEQAK
jgi:hypothetical protein